MPLYSPASESGAAAWGDISGTLANQADLGAALDDKEDAGAVAAHEAGANPHPDYLTVPEADLLYSALGSVATHEADTTSVHGIADTSALLDTADIGVSVQAYAAVLAATTASFSTADETKLDGIEAGATADQTNAEIETAYNAQVGAASQAEAEAGTESAIRRFSPLRIAQAIAALAGEGGGITLDDVYPVGCIYTSTVSTNPATVFGMGTWAAFGAGRVLVGLDSGDTDFDTVEETGGAKTHTLTEAEMPAHTHTQRVMSASSGGLSGVFRDTSSNTVVDDAQQTGSKGGDGAHNNLQPYIIVHFFKRVA